VFKVQNIDDCGPKITVYAVTTLNNSEDIMFLIWKDGEWIWEYADAYGPALE